MQQGIGIPFPEGDPAFDANLSTPSRHRFLRSGMMRFDYILLGSLWLLTIPVFQIAKLPYEFDLRALTEAYLRLPVGAVLVAIILAVLGFPIQSTFLPLFRRLWNQKSLIFFLALIAALLCWALGIAFGMVLLIEALAFAEFSQRCSAQLGEKLLDVLVPGAYLYFGLLVVFAFNHAIVGIRYGGTEDHTLNQLDGLLFHANVSNIAHWSFHHLPLAMFKWWDFIYFSIWSRFGASLLLVILCGSRKQGIQFVRNILICYSIALLVFAVVPAKGPYSICRIHAQDYPKCLGSYNTQAVLVSRMKELHEHSLREEVREVGVGDYFISFPSLHAALPIIGLWFLRRWKRVQRIAILFYCMLLPSLILLGWHYFVDIAGGWGVAGLSIATTEWISGRIEHVPENSPIGSRRILVAPNRAVVL